MSPLAGEMQIASKGHEYFLRRVLFKKGPATGLTGEDFKLSAQLQVGASELKVTKNVTQDADLPKMKTVHIIKLHKQVKRERGKSKSILSLSFRFVQRFHSLT